MRMIAILYLADVSMVRLSSLIQNMVNGMSLQDAQMAVDNMVSDSDYPRAECLKDRIPTTTVELAASQ